MRRWCLVMLATVMGCSESREGVGDAATGDVAMEAAADGARPADDASADVAIDRAATDASAPDAEAMGTLVVNELRAAGDEWVELYNAGTRAVDLSNAQVADTDPDGGPRVSRAMRFGAGTMLAPGQYVLVVANQSDAGAGPQVRCLDGGPSTCFHAEWSLSASRGESVYVLAADGGTIAEGNYPANAAPDGGTWGRLPNGSGSFTVTRPTPGAANAAP